MNEPLATAEQQLMRAMALNEHSVARRRAFVGLTAEDGRRIAEIRSMVLDHLEEHTAAFFGFLGTLEESRGLMGRRDAL
ncbi:MAG TPA: hypothetical protein VFG69_09170, partial [Nannocystaceae bacterium]|nr:hypothetical protein [Nannocystaceae bacterium]